MGNWTLHTISFSLLEFVGTWQHNLAAIKISPKINPLPNNNLVRNLVTMSKLGETCCKVPMLLPVIIQGHVVSAAEWVAAAWTLPLGWAETGRWSRVCQWPGLWSRAAAVCKRFSSWRAPRWRPPASTERSVSHTGSHNPRLVSREEAGGKRGEGEEEAGERRKKTLRT